ncbi:hypothetical protein [Bdellovibrio sp. NC01]|uniref:hypothetical protein n=1 Tax=Bdellovibrio sp. NC01 TaxID=2220073 RepID=UPI0011588EB1|nr:hypothetical protein [Bdellovibrio sp. NC01]QDK38286.1 hypothetical protein DOE51_12205 [Bdellovibrio sp. NC01]
MRLFKYLTIFIVLFSLGFAKDGIVELEGYLNGRSSANFLKSTNNVKFVLPPGTRGKIQETKQFSSGNYGLKVAITSGPRKGEEAWVYYRTSDPDMKVYENEQAAQKDQETKDVANAKETKTIRETPAVRDPASEKPKEEKKPEPKKVEEKKPVITKKASDKLPKDDAEELVRKVQDANKTLANHGKPGGPCPECELAKVHSRDVGINEDTNPPTFTAKSSQDSGRIIPPTRTQNPFGIRPTRCGSGQGAIDYCTYEGDSQPGNFKFRNRGPNNIVSAGDANRSREWAFYHEGNARQDLGFAISDMPNGTISQTQETYMMVFPRKTIPNVRIEGDKQIVTLPTGETVTFDKNSKKVIGGVLSEDGAMTSGGKSLQPAKVSYHGNGVMVRVDTRGDEPRLKAANAVITKQGKTCTVPAKKLWPDRSEHSSAHFKYFSDSDFDAFLKSTCGFGL